MWFAKLSLVFLILENTLIPRICIFQFPGVRADIKKALPSALEEEYKHVQNKLPSRGRG